MNKGDIIEQCVAVAAILLHHLDLFARLEAVNVIHCVPQRGSGPVCWEGGSQSLCASSLPHSSQCQPSACVSGISVLYQVWAASLNQEMIAASHDSWCGLAVTLYILDSRNSILSLKAILWLLRAVPVPMGSVSWAEQRPELVLHTFDRPQEAEQYKCLRGSLDSFPFIFFLLHTKSVVCYFSVSGTARLDLCRAAALYRCTADLALNPFFAINTLFMPSLWSKQIILKVAGSHCRLMPRITQVQLSWYLYDSRGCLPACVAAFQMEL